jgi:hypothetical protein
VSNSRHHRRSVRRGQLEQVYLEAQRESPRFVRTLPGDLEVWQRGEVAFVLPSIPLGASPAIREALERRRRASLNGVCPCGGRLHLRRMHPGGMSVQLFVHENTCMAADGNLAPLLKVERSRWSA